MKNFKLIQVNGRTHVLCGPSVNRDIKQQPNYQKTGMALCGVLEPNDTLDDWMRKGIEFKEKRAKEEAGGLS